MESKKEYLTEILCQQIELLAEESKKIEDVNVKICIASEIDKIADTLLIFAMIKSAVNV